MIHTCAKGRPGAHAALLRKAILRALPKWVSFSQGIKVGAGFREALKRNHPILGVPTFGCVKIWDPKIVFSFLVSPPTILKAHLETNAMGCLQGPSSASWAKATKKGPKLHMGRS